MSLATIKANTPNTHTPRTLHNVDLETLQVFVGRQHSFEFEVEGKPYQLMLGAEQGTELDSVLYPGRAPVPEALAPGQDSKASIGSQLVPQDWWKQREGCQALPSVTLSGPLELVLGEAAPISLFTPLAADVGVVRRLVLGVGVTVQVAGAKSVKLRRPVDMPRLPGSYLAEVYAHARLGEPEEGYHFAPGILSMATRLHAESVNSSATAKQRHLLSFEVETVGYGSLTVSSTLADGPSQRLKVKRQKDGSVELSPRQQGKPSSQWNAAALAHVHAWPLPSLPMSSWMPYEDVLRGVLASLPLSLDMVMRQGIGLRLTKSFIQGVSLLAFDMGVRSRKEHPENEGQGFARVEEPLEIWEVVVQIEQQAGSLTAHANPSGFKYTPIRLKQKAVHENTVTVNLDGMQKLWMNASVPLGYDTEDLGIARSAEL